MYVCTPTVLLSQWIYSKNLSLRFLEKTEVYSSREPLATAFSWASQHTALFYMLLSNTQQIHDHSLRPGAHFQSCEEDAHQTHTFPSAPFPPLHTQDITQHLPHCAWSHFFFKQKVWERGQAWHYERHLHSMRREIQKQEGIRLSLCHGCALGTAIYTNTLPLQNRDYTKP